MLTDAQRFWERHEGSRMRVRAGSGAVSGRDVFSSTADAELWVVDRDDPLLDRADPYSGGSSVTRTRWTTTRPGASTTATASGRCSAAWA